MCSAHLKWAFLSDFLSFLNTNNTQSDKHCSQPRWLFLKVVPLTQAFLLMTTLFDDLKTLKILCTFDLRNENMHVSL